MRSHKLGARQTLHVEHLLREMRRHIRSTGRAPRLDANDPALQFAWIKLSRQLEHNAKISARGVV